MSGATARLTALSLVLVTALLSGCAPASRIGPKASSAPASPTASTGSETDATAPSASPSGTQGEPSPTNSPPNSSVVLVTFGADADGVYASGIVPEVVESGGRCVLTATTGDDSRTGELDAAPSTSAMNCGVIHIPVPSGAWELTLSYTSNETSASSESTSVIVP